MEVASVHGSLHVGTGLGGDIRGLEFGIRAAYRNEDRNMIDGQSAATYALVAVAAGYVARSVWNQISGAVQDDEAAGGPCGSGCGCGSAKPDLPEHLSVLRQTITKRHDDANSP
jgi:hypothetical protein